MARKEVDRAEGVDEPDEEDDGEVLFVNPTKPIRTGKPTITQTSDGDFHVCFGLQCPHAELRRGYWTCAITGHLGVELKGSSDPSWTGRSTGSANPDDAAGAHRRLDQAPRHVRPARARGRWPRPFAAAATAAPRRRGRGRGGDRGRGRRPRSDAAPQARRSRRRARGVRRGGGRRRARARPLRAPAGGQAPASRPPRSSASSSSTPRARRRRRRTRRPGQNDKSSIRGSNLEFVRSTAPGATFGTAAPERCGSASRRCTTSASTPTSLCASSASRPGQRGRDRDGAARGARGHGGARARADCQPHRQPVASGVLDAAHAQQQKGQRQLSALCGGHPLFVQARAVLERRHVRGARAADADGELVALRSTQSTPAAKQPSRRRTGESRSFHRSISSAANCRRPRRHRAAAFLRAASGRAAGARVQH